MGLREHIPTSSAPQAMRLAPCRLDGSLILLLDLLREGHFVLNLVEVGEQHTQEEAEEVDLSDEEQADVHESVEDALEPSASSLRRAAAGPHRSVHDGVPVLARHDLEDRDEAPSEVVEVCPRDTALTLIVELVAEMSSVRAPGVSLFTLVGQDRGEAGRRVVGGLVELEPVVKEVHPRQRADVKHEEEQDEPVLERLARRNHGLQQNLQGRRPRRELVQHAEQPQGPERLQTSGAASIQGDHFLNHGNDHHDAIEARGGILEVPLEAARRELEGHLDDEDEEEDVSDVSLGSLQGHLRWEFLHHHDDDVARDDKHDEEPENIVLRNPSCSPHGGAVEPWLLVECALLVVVVVDVSIEHRDALRKLLLADALTLRLLLLVRRPLLLLVLEVLACLINHGKGHVQEEVGADDDQQEEVQPTECDVHTVRCVVHEVRPALHGHALEDQKEGTADVIKMHEVRRGKPRDGTIGHARPLRRL
mmetsp:Transcript_9381/g.25111  ORF Transcript_9381/g.25111 Transcript_9381/m.25111 type:complete len:478 (+) Transcript_9381:3544-4977(+)